MTQIARVPLGEPLRKVRIHMKRDAERDGPSPKLIWLLNLLRHQEQQDAQHEAILSAIQSIQRALAELPNQVSQKLEEVSALAIELGLTIGREILGKAVDLGHFDPSEIVRRCLATLVDASERSALAVAMHPMDLSLVMNALESEADLRASAAECTFHVDESLQRGSVRIATAAGALLYDPREVYERIAHEIRRGASA